MFALQFISQYLAMGRSQTIKYFRRSDEYKESVDAEYRKRLENQNSLELVQIAFAFDRLARYARCRNAERLAIKNRKSPVVNQSALAIIPIQIQEQETSESTYFMCNNSLSTFFSRLRVF